MEATFHAITYSDIFINVIDKNKRLLMSRRSVFESFLGSFCLQYYHLDAEWNKQLFLE